MIAGAVPAHWRVLSAGYATPSGRGRLGYRADEGWIITTSTFTPKARELARSTRVRLIDGKELAEWLEGLREQE